jgi:outer membrane protein assembly factor BamD (BamD/ComL family)
MPPALTRPLPALLVAFTLVGSLGAAFWWLRSPAPAPPTLASAARPARSIEAPDTSDRDQLLRAEADHYQQLKHQTDPARALEMADEGHERYVRGNLYPDREVIAIRSLVRLGQQEQSRSRARRFLSRYPQSPHAETVRRFAGLPQ